MSTPHQEWPLRRHQVCDTGDVGEFTDRVIASVGGRTVSVDRSGGFRAHGCLAELKTVSLTHGGCTTGVAIQFPEIDLFRLVMADTGHGHAVMGQRHYAIDAQQACLIPPGRSSTLAGSDHHGFLTLRVRPAVLAGRMAAISGRPPRLNSDRAVRIDTTSPDMMVLRSLSRALCEALDTPSATELLVGDIENAILTALVGASTGDLSDDAPLPSATDVAVRTAAEYITANVNRSVSLEELVAVSGVSARTLARGFRRSYGFTPHEFVKQRRLEHARMLLGTASDTTTVTQVALGLGFLNLGHFSKDYALAFGEKPSVTLRRARQSGGV